MKADSDQIIGILNTILIMLKNNRNVEAAIFLKEFIDMLTVGDTK